VAILKWNSTIQSFLNLASTERVIFDLSSPRGFSVNDGIPKEYGTLVYETLNNAVQLIAQAGKGAVLAKRDLKAAFRHIPVHPCDYWLLVFE